MKISIITVVYNGAATIAEAVESVIAQDYPGVEYIVIDGGSKDQTLAILEHYRSGITTLISEPDKGIYDAMNKGIRNATGDIIGILNADDLYANNHVISEVAKAFENPEIDCMYADLVFFRTEEPEKVVRYYDARNFKLRRFEYGDMPPHPTFFVRRELYDRHGVFDTSFRICADYELMLRFLYIHKAKAKYLPKVLVRMRTGGASDGGWKGRLKVNKEIQRGMRQNGLYAPMWKIYLKYFQKVWQLVKRPEAGEG